MTYDKLFKALSEFYEKKNWKVKFYMQHSTFSYEIYHSQDAFHGKPLYVSTIFYHGPDNIDSMGKSIIDDIKTNRARLKKENPKPFTYLPQNDPKAQECVSVEDWTPNDPRPVLDPKKMTVTVDGKTIKVKEVKAKDLVQKKPLLVPLKRDTLMSTQRQVTTPIKKLIVRTPKFGKKRPIIRKKRK
jgi:hypothetical protein